MIPAAGAGKFSVRDGEGREYAALPADRDAEVGIAGSLGTHTVLHLDDEGRVLDTCTFRVDCETEIADEGGRFGHLLDMLYDTMFQHWTAGYTKFVRINGKRYKFYVSWLRDHVHALKGMKYWDDDIKTGIELYADSQREDGMIWDKCKQMCHSELQTYRDYQFADGDFVRKIPGNPTRRWMRIPVENDVEFLFIEGLYYTWKACGDDEWMKGMLDNAIGAVRYSTSDRYRWSEKYQLLKRGYTIDTWDFQSADDARRSGSVMRVVPGVTEFNIFHGDNTGMAIGCIYLAEMLRTAGRGDEAGEYERLGGELKGRLDALAWNGDFYTHMVPENPEARRDLGETPTDRQVTLSNAYALNRRIDHEQCAAIIRTYLRLREEMPKTSAGEWYNCYPPFDKGFRSKWDYMNGGVSTITAGELAHGAFEHGFEDYAVDILDRLIGLAERFGGYLHNTFKGKLPDPPPAPNFEALDLRAVADVDLCGQGADGVVGWMGDPENDMSGLPTGRQSFAGVVFDVIDPAKNGRRAALGIAHAPGWKEEQTVAVGARARALYLLHTVDGQGLVGWMTVNYADGSHETEYIQTGKQVESWFMPAPDETGDGYKHQIHVGGRARAGVPYRMGWQGPNRKFENVGVFCYGWDNPHPDREIRDITFAAAETSAKWLVLGVTLSDQPVYFPASAIGRGIPDMWGAAAVVYALIEGLAGIVDTGKAYESVRLCPRWAVAGVDKVTACATYPASGGYVRYRYSRDRERGALTIEVAGNAETMQVEVFLPPGSGVRSAVVDGRAVDAPAVRQVEQSRYLTVALAGLGVHRVEILLS